MIDWDNYDQIVASTGRHVQRQTDNLFFIVHGSSKLAGPFSDNETAAEKLIETKDQEFNFKTDIAVRGEHSKPKARPLIKKKNQSEFLLAL